MAKQKLPPTQTLRPKSRSSLMTPPKPRAVEGGKQARGVFQYVPGDWSPRRNNKSSQKPYPSANIQQTDKGQNYRRK